MADDLSRDTLKLAHALAAQTGETVDQAIRVALQERLARLPPPVAPRPDDSSDTDAEGVYP